MKKILFTIIFLVHALDPFAQTESTIKDDCECKPPTWEDTKPICDCITLREKAVGKDLEHFEYGYEVRLMKMAGADIEKDGRNAAYKKLQCFWNKYKTKFTCSSLNFNVHNGSILKFSFALSFSNFTEVLAGTYGLDIWFKDPADGLTLCEYLQKELIETIKDKGINHPRVKALSNYMDLISGIDPSLSCDIPKIK